MCDYLVNFKFLMFNYSLSEQLTLSESNEIRRLEEKLKEVEKVFVKTKLNI